MLKISQALATIRQEIIITAQQFERSADEITLLAVSKTRPVEDLMTAIECGQFAFGENYVQEAIPKIQTLRHDHNHLIWHFIGPLQSNKTRLIAEHFDWIQSLDDLKQAQRLNDQRPPQLPPLNICIQVNVSEESQKSGIQLADLPLFAQTVAQLPRLHLRGLMTIPAYSEEFTEQRKPFHILHTAYRQLQQAGFQLDTLSMGMTDDMSAAIAEGSTMVRIGTGIFGARENNRSIGLN
ncbi:MAG: YggS family pyridoxal phosphate enzyme [Beggiatoa sp. IS2]|nr:MAG: YggS family pyridoxal phosphate enzyme [Beggiatoa sp. IS2]